MHELIPGICYSCTADITQVHAKAIVNAANSTLLGGGGVDGAIHAAAGPTLLAACRQLRERQYPDGLPVGEAVSTHAGRLPAEFVIHTVGPVWHGGKQGEPGLLAAAYRNSLREAERLGCTSVAFPAVSTGVYGYPRDLAAGIVRDTICTYIRETAAPVKIFLVFFSHHDEQVFRSVFERPGAPPCR